MGHSHDTVPVSPTGAQRIALLEAAQGRDEQSIALVDDAVSSPEPALRATALSALSTQGRLDAGRLATALGDADPSVRRRAAQLSFGPRLRDEPSVTAALLSALDDEDVFVAVAVLVALGERADATALEAVTAVAASSTEPLVVEEAVATLGALGDEASIDVIAELLSTAKPALRRRIVAAIGAFSGPKVEAMLVQLEGDRDWQVRQAVAMLRRGD